MKWVRAQRERIFWYVTLVIIIVAMHGINACTSGALGTAQTAVAGFNIAEKAAVVRWCQNSKEFRVAARNRINANLKGAGVNGADIIIMIDCGDEAEEEDAEKVQT